jgi:hypothetical protein
MSEKPKKSRVIKNTLDKINEHVKALALVPPDDFSAMDVVRQSFPNIERALESGHAMAKVHEGHRQVVRHLKSRYVGA